MTQAESLRAALRETTEAFHALNWHDRPVFGRRAWTLAQCPIDRCRINRELLAATPPAEGLEHSPWRDMPPEEWDAARQGATPPAEGLDAGEGLVRAAQNVADHHNGEAGHHANDTCWRTLYAILALTPPADTAMSDSQIHSDIALDSPWSWPDSGDEVERGAPDPA